MPVDFTLDPVTRVVHSRAAGHVSEAEMAEHARAIVALFAVGTLDASWAQLLDFSEAAEAAHISSDMIRRVAQYNPWPSTIRRVFVSPQEVIFGLLRMYQVFADLDAEHFFVARSTEEALEWLALHPPPP